MPRLPKPSMGHIAFRRDIISVVAYITLVTRLLQVFKFTFKFTLTFTPVLLLEVITIKLFATDNVLVQDHYKPVRLLIAATGHGQIQKTGEEVVNVIQYQQVSPRIGVNYSKTISCTIRNLPPSLKQSTWES